MSQAVDDKALRDSVKDVVGRGRAFILLLQSARDEISSLHDDRASRLIGALDHTLREPAELGSLRYVERAATELLQSLRGASR